jgi:hypothetical protein
MDQKLKELLEPAFREVPAREANREIARARREQAGGDPDDDDAPAVRSYELVLTTWESFVREQLPKLIYHLESVGARLPECRGVMLSVFVGERLWFIEAKLAVARHDGPALRAIRPRREAHRGARPLAAHGAQGSKLGFKFTASNRPT